MKICYQAISELDFADSRTPQKQESFDCRAPVAPGLRRLADRLSDVFDTRVKVEMGRHKGKIIVEFATPEDLERIVKAMSPDAVRLESAD